MNPDEIRTIIREELQNCHLPSSCPITKDAAKEIGHFFGMVKDIGNGDMRQGVETFRADHKFINSLSSINKKFGTLIAGSILVSTIAAILGLLWLGFKGAVLK